MCGLHRGQVGNQGGFLWLLTPRQDDWSLPSVSTFPSNWVENKGRLLLFWSPSRKSWWSKSHWVFFWVTHSFGISHHSQEDKEYEWLDHLPIPATRNTILWWLFLPIMRLKWSLRSFWWVERHMLAGRQPQLYPRSPAPSPESKQKAKHSSLGESFRIKIFRILSLFYSVDQDLSWSLSCYLTDPDKEPVLRTTSQEEKVQNLERIRRWTRHMLTMQYLTGF